MMTWDEVDEMLARRWRPDTRPERLWDVVRRMDAAMRQPVKEYGSRDLAPELREEDRR